MRRPQNDTQADVACHHAQLSSHGMAALWEYSIMMSHLTIRPVSTTRVIVLASMMAHTAIAAQPEDGFCLPLGADIIAAPWEPDPKLVDDYAESTYGEKWDFEDGRAARIAEVGAGMLGYRVEDGKLKFTTARRDAWFSWGDADGKSSQHRQEKFRWNHPYWSVGIVRLRMKQSASESKWRVSWGRWTELSRPTPRRGRSRGFTLRGTDWQTVDVRLGRRGEHFHSWLAVETTTPENRVEIDEIRIVRTSERACYRMELEIPSRPVFGGIWYVAQPEYDIHVNGQKIHTWDGNGCGWWPAWIEITRWLNRGRNCIAVDRELIDWMGRMNFLVVGGVVRCEDGRIVRIGTDSNWRMNRTSAPGWTKAGFDDSPWPRAKSCGDASRARFPKGVTGLDEMWRACLDMGYQVIPPRHLGALELSYPRRPDPLFSVDEPVVLTATAPRRAFDGKRYQLSYRLYDSVTRRQIDVGPLREVSSKKTHQRWQFERVGLAQGVYALCLDLALDGHREETAFVEIAVCGSIGGRKVRGGSIEEGLELTLADTIDCGAPDDSHFRIYGEYRAPRPSLPKPKIVDNPVAGAVLELSRGWQWAGYRIRFEDATRPYLVRVSYPDVHSQVLGLRIDQPYKGRGRYQCITSCAAYTCRETPPTGKMAHFSTLTWPKVSEATLCLVNYNGPKPTLVKRVEIFRIDNELPQLDLPNASRDRVFGYATERGTTALSTFFQSPVGWRFEHHMHNCATTATLRHWWIAGENLVRWLKFTGQSAWCFNAHMYGQTYYPTALASRFEKSAFHNHLPLLAKMFEANGLTLYAGSEFMSARPIWKRNIYTDDEVAEGADTIKAVSSEGRQQLHFAEAGANYQHPIVEEAIVRMVRDLCEPMAAYPAFKGVHFMCGGYFAPGVFKLHRQFDLFKNSYDDTSLRRFEQFANVKVPDFGRTKEKFARRRAWIEHNAKQKWVAWRCAAVTGLVERCAKAAASVREDLRCVFNWGDWSYGQSRTRQWAEGRRYADVAAELGIDYQALMRIPNTIHGERLEQLGAFIHPNDAIEGAFVAEQQSSEIRANFDVASHSAYLHHPFSEGSLTVAATKGWPWTTTLSCTWSPRPVQADYLANFTRALSAGVPSIMWHGYCDTQHYSGGEQDIRAVTRAYRTIPPGSYTELDERIRAKNVLVRVNRDGRSFLAINPAWWPVECEVSLEGKAPTVTHLNSARKSPGPKLHVRLAPFALESFGLEKGSRLAGVMGTVSLRAAQETMEEAAARLESYGQSIARTEAPLDEGARHLLTTAERLRSYVDAGALGRAYHLTKSIDYCRAVNWGKRNLACSTFLVMGPFDNPSRRFFKAPTPVENDILAGKRSAEAYVGKGGKTVAWRRVRSRMTGGSPGFLDFVEICGPAQEAVAYALVYVRSPKRQQVTLLLGSDDSIRAWINRELVVSDFADRGVRPRQAIGRGTLRKGWNTLLFKVDQNVGGWAAYIEILGRRRDALSGVTFSTEFPYN